MKYLLFALVVAWGIGLLLIPSTIPLLKRLKFGQNIRTDGPQQHLIKSGTPTMGGIAFAVVLVLSMLFLADIGMTSLLAVGIALLYGLLGFLDDFIKTVKKRSLGLKAYQKMSGEIIIAGLLIYSAVVYLGRGTTLALPGYGFTEVGIFYYILAFILIVGVTNGVNLNDGLDGLAAGVSFFVYLGYTLISYYCIEHPPFPMVDYTVLTIFGAVMSGICLSFLFFNHYPAKVFMGDTGSLLLGGGIAVLSILTGTELLLIVMGGVFVVEALSVMMQVASFKLTGKRVFLMAPLHHHFEQLGWKEIKVVFSFWLGSLLFVLSGLFIYFKF
jgi:phospho-N-acetylmuramoyl-pentapeptide-transferase